MAKFAYGSGLPCLRKLWPQSSDQKLSLKDEAPRQRALFLESRPSKGN